MTNTTMFHKMITEYDNASYTHNYIFGFSDRGIIYLAIADSSILPYVCKLDVASRNAGYSLRFKPSKTQKEFLKQFSLIPICSCEAFENLFANSKYNRGEIFEKLVTEYFGQIWEKDNVPFTEAGDIEVDGIAYQIKYEKATFANEKTLLNLGA